MIKNSYNKRFSIANWDSSDHDDLFLNCFENSSEQCKNEVYDIFFGAIFLHRDVSFGETMGVTASPGQYKNLLKIQEKYGIPISLTLNEMNRPMEMVRTDVIKDFISFIKTYYDDGVRSCTISHVHLMKMGVLQEAFPDMDWKNTVNHCIGSTQEMVDYASIGYTTVQLDRKFNRNLNELKRAKKEATRLGIKTCLLVREGCMPECPFKTEHDVWQGGKLLRDIGQSYWEAIPFTCSSWNKTLSISPETQKEFDKKVLNPRIGTNIMAHSKDDWDDFANNVDIFKTSGRLSNPSPDEVDGGGLGFYFEMWKDPKSQMNYQKELFQTRSTQVQPPQTHMFKVDSFKEIYENNLAPIHMWQSHMTHRKDYPIITDIDEIKKISANHFWNVEEAVALQTTLKRCKNQCYNCHKCDDLFQTGNIDSISNL